MNDSVFSLEDDAPYTEALQNKLNLIKLQKEEEEKKYVEKLKIQAGKLLDPYAPSSKQFRKLDTIADSHIKKELVIRSFKNNSYYKYNKNPVFDIIKDENKAKLKKSLFLNKSKKIKKRVSPLSSPKKQQDRVQLSEIFECYFPQCEFACQRITLYFRHVKLHK